MTLRPSRLLRDSRHRATGYGVLNMFGPFVGGITIYIGGARCVIRRST